jgi:hypothetical protein
VSKYPNIQPLGLLTVVTPGTTTLLSANSGPMGGGVGGTPQNPPLAGSAMRGVVLQASVQNVGNVYLMPRGRTFAANPGDIIALIAPGAIIPVPYGVLLDNGIQPENFCLDADTGGNTVYGYGIF